MTEAEIQAAVAQAAAAPEEPSVGSRLRELRKARRLRLIDLADRSGLSETFLSQLERGKANASVTSLLKIANALDLGVADLFSSAEGNKPKVLKQFERPALSFGVNSRKYMITPKPLTHLEVFTAEIGPGGSSGEEPYSHGDSEEVFLVLSGNVVLELDGVDYPMADGDSIKYRSSLLHRVSNRSDQPAEVLWIISPPSY